MFDVTPYMKLMHRSHHLMTNMNLEKETGGDFRPVDRMKRITLGMHRRNFNENEYRLTLFFIQSGKAEEHQN